MTRQASHSAKVLRELLLESALDILSEEKTPLALRKVAERAGKSRTAPYLVFGQTKDGGGLIGLKLAVASRGTEMLHSAVRTQIASVSDPRVAFERATKAFLTFAKENPRLFRLMFGPEVAEISAQDSATPTNYGRPLIEHPEHSGLIDARINLELILKDLIEGCQKAGYIANGDIFHNVLVVTRAWIALLGTASLMHDPVYRSVIPLTIDQFVDLAAGAILDEATKTVDGLRNAAISLLAAQKLRQETESQDEETTIDHLPFAAPYTAASAKEELLDSLADFAIPELDATHNDFSGTPLDQLAGDLFETLREHLSGNIPDHHQQSDSSEPIKTIEYNAALRRASLARDVFEGSRVLWIDDEIDSVELEKQTLEHLGIRVTTARTTQEALGQLRTASFDLILSDIERAGDPDEGVLVIPQFEEIDPNTPIIFYIAQFDEQRGIPQGASGITNRPDELLHLVLDQLERARI